jgi:hypothetical protein
VGDLAHSIQQVSDAEVNTLTKQYDDHRVSAGRRRPPPIPARCGQNRTRITAIPREHRCEGVHRYIRRPAWTQATSRNRRAASHGRWVRIWR